MVDEKKTHNELPPADVLKRLAVSQSGFVFDPVSGRSFSVNPTGLRILGLLQQETDIAALIETLTAEYDVDRRQAERDVGEFVGVLREQLHAL